MKKRGRGGSDSACAVSVVDHPTDCVELACGVPVLLGRRSFKSRVLRADQRISRKQLELQFDDKTGCVRASPVAAAPNPSFRQDSGGGWVRLAPGDGLYDGDQLKLVADAPALRVAVRGRCVVYDKRARPAPECLYGLQCTRREEAAHAAKYSHSEPAG